MYTIYGSIEHYKVCSVARGYTQTEGKYFLDAFPPMSKLKIVWLLLSIIAIQNWSLQHLDIDNAFLHEDLHEEVRMIVPKILVKFVIFLNLYIVWSKLVVTGMPNYLIPLFN